MPENEDSDSLKNTQKVVVMEFDIFFRQHYASLCYFAFQIIKDQHESEDVVQNAFMKLHPLLEDFNSENAAKGFLYTCIRNECFNNLRHVKVHEKFTVSNQNSQINEGHFLNSIIETEVLDAVYLSIEQLPEGCRNILKMTFFEEMKNQEVADKLGISINTVKTQKQRAVQLLKLRLKDFYFTLPFIIKWL